MDSNEDYKGRCGMRGKSYNLCNDCMEKLNRSTYPVAHDDNEEMYSPYAASEKTRNT